MLVWLPNSGKLRVSGPPRAVIKQVLQVLKGFQEEHKCTSDEMHADTTLGSHGYQIAMIIRSRASSGT